MADSLHFDKLTKHREAVDLHGIFTWLGNTTPANGTGTVVRGKQAFASIARTGVGAYRITLKEKYFQLLGVQIHLAPHSAGARQIEIGAINLTNKTVDFVIKNASLAAAETPNNETDTIYLTLTVRNSSVNDPD